MAQRKSHEVDRWLSRPDPDTRIVLVYGPDRGLVSERARQFAATTGIPLDDPFAVAKLEASDVESDPGRLFDEAATISMFGGRRLIWVRNVGSHKAVAEAIKNLVASPPEESLVICEAGELKKGAPLRAAVEAGGRSMALPCYPDEGREVDHLIDSEFRAAGLSIDAEARRLLKSTLGGDRLATRGEIEKLALFAAGKTSVDVDDVLACAGDVSAVSTDQVIDALLSGRLADFDALMLKALASGTAPFLILSASIRQFQTLMALRSAMETDGRSAGAAVASARPPVFFARRAIIEGALGNWTTAELAQHLDRLQKAVLLTRRRPELATEAVRHVLMAITVSARRSASRPHSASRV